MKWGSTCINPFGNGGFLFYSFECIIRNMKAPSITILKKYLTAMTKIKAKYITAERLSKVVGQYPEIINENLSYFDPMIKMDPTADLLELVPAIKQFIVDSEAKKEPVVRKELVTKKDLGGYESINDFIYQKMSFGGMLNKEAYLNDKDLKILKKLIADEQAKRKNKK